MKTLKELLEGLKDEDRRVLMLAFEHGLEQIVYVEDGKFLGVNVGTIKGLTIQQQAGRWAYGEVNEDHRIRASAADR